MVIRGKYMITYKNLVLIGTSHIAKQSIEEVKKNFLSYSPEIVCIELDKQRLQGLLSKNQQKPNFLKIIKEVGFKGFLFSLIGEWAEKKLGKIVGVKPGADMLEAVRLARINQVPLALIDKDIRIVLKQISKELTFKEKWTFIKELFAGMISRKPKFQFDLTKVPSKELIKTMTGHLKKYYPTLYKIIIKERNEYMANKLQVLMEKNPEKKMMAVVGAGHEEEIIDLIKSYELKEIKETNSKSL
jgi:pheromone shutdown-related protein TraB